MKAVNTQPQAVAVSSISFAEWPQPPLNKGSLSMINSFQHGVMGSWFSGAMAS